MKKVLLIGFIVCLLGTLVACGRSVDSALQEEASSASISSAEQIVEGSQIAEESTPAPTENNEETVLIAYFSLSDIVPEGADAVASATPYVGSTEYAAMEIQRQVGGDLFAIKTEESYPVSHADCSEIAENELRTDARPELSTHLESMEQYDTVYIGYPIWWYQEPMAIRTFLEEYDLSGKKIIPFCTSLGAGISESERSIEALCPDAVVEKGLALRTGQEDFSRQISEWLVDIGEKEEATDLKIKITVGDTELTATLEDNATTRYFVEQMPMTLPMMDLYGREMCYRYGAYALPTDAMRSDGYEVGDIAYWAPGGSLVILYAQNGEHFERQQVGHIDSGVEVFETTGDTDVTFELME